MDMIGQTVSHYRILSKLGGGGMGIVYEAEDIRLGRRVALKVLPFAAAIDPKQRQRFQIEAQAAAQLHHPHIVVIYEVGWCEGRPYLATEFVAGGTLAQHCSGVPQPPRCAAEFHQKMGQGFQSSAKV